MILLGFLAGRGGLRALKVTRRELAAAAVVGALLLLGGNGLVAVAEKTVPSGLAALIVGAVRCGSCCCGWAVASGQAD